MGEPAERADRSESAAEYYERLFVPPMMAPWAQRVADAAHVGPGDRVLDVACGTGAVTQEALRRVGPDGYVAGLDLRADMLAVARRKLPTVVLIEGRAEALPFDDSTFDVVTCQFGLMFFEDRAAALQQMRRVLRPGGRLSVAVWDSLERTPGYAALVRVIERHLGVGAGAPLRSPFLLGDVDTIRSMLEAAGFTAVRAHSVEGTVRFPSLRDWVAAELEGWIGGDIPGRHYAAILADAERNLAPFRQTDGTVEVALPAILGTAGKG